MILKTVAMSKCAISGVALRPVAGAGYRRVICEATADVAQDRLPHTEHGG